ncbi:5'-nucleotidase [Bradyrhizobium sp. NBAIM14]|nr:5'-nucleotidase [Bradyrhizobium sp. NBAIM14]
MKNPRSRSSFSRAIRPTFPSGHSIPSTITTRHKGGQLDQRPLARLFISARELDLFLSNAIADVQAPIEAGAAAAKLGTARVARQEDPSDEVRIASDGDAIAFSADPTNS